MSTTSSISIDLRSGTGGSAFGAIDFAAALLEQWKDAHSAPRVPIIAVEAASKVALTEIPAAWLPRVERRIKLSAARQGDDELTSIPSNLVESGLRFFQATSDLLPSEPYLYVSKNGDLVAEHKTIDTTFVSVIGSDAVLVMTVEGGAVRHDQIPAKCGDFEEARHVIRRLRGKGQAY